VESVLGNPGGSVCDHRLLEVEEERQGVRRGEDRSGKRDSKTKGTWPCFEGLRLGGGNTHTKKARTSLS
jgi:hypothetical protein